MFTTIRLFCLCLLASGTTLAATRELNLDMAAQDFARLDIETGQGGLEVTGTAGPAVLARLTLEFPDDWTDEEMQEFIDQHVDFEFSGSGSNLELLSKLDDGLSRGNGRGPFYWWNDGPSFPSVLLEVSVPAALNLDIRDGSGDTAIRGITGHLNVRDGSGNLEIEDIGGDVFIDDNSGNLDVRGVAGSLDITDGSGNIDARDIGTFARIRDGSGNIDVEQVGGDLQIRDGSGRVSTAGITGAVDIRD